MTTTIRDVAKQAGVGLGTVSRVINENPSVSENTRQRVLQAIDDLGFRPSPIARSLSLGRTHTIAAMVTFLTRPATVERLRGVELTIAGSEYDLIVFNIETPERRDTAFLDVAWHKRVDGLLVISLPPTPESLDQLRHAKLPLVLIDVNRPDLESFPRVIVDDVNGSRQAVEYLIGLGHRRIGFISDPLDDPYAFTSSRDRFTGYKEALRNAGLTLDPQLHRHGEHGRFTAGELAREMLQLKEPPTAIFAASDTQALGMLETARSNGLRVPQDLSVMGYDDIDLAEYLKLTTVRQQLFESGQAGVQMLLECIADPDGSPRCEVLATELVVRGTTAPPL
jgi:LacI family transcriptional regulator